MLVLGAVTWYCYLLLVQFFIVLCKTLLSFVAVTELIRPLLKTSKIIIVGKMGSLNCILYLFSRIKSRKRNQKSVKHLWKDGETGKWRIR